MGVYIKGMEMPDNCMKCDIRAEDDDGPYCPFTKVTALNIGRQYDCPLVVEVPEPHGRLVDADDVKSRMMPLSFSVQKWISEVQLSHCKTVIEAEGE